MAGLPEKEKFLQQMGDMYDEIMKWKKKALQFESIIDDKNRHISDLEKKMTSERLDDLTDILTDQLAMGHLIKRMRIDAGLSLDKLSRKLFMSKTTLNNIERGYSKLITAQEAYERVREMKKRGELNK